MKNLTILFISCFGLLIQAQDDVFFTDADAFFKTHVSNGRVDYQTIKKDTSTLDDLLDQIAVARVSPDPDKSLAFYINTYNLLTIKGIVDHYPIKQPLEVSGFFESIKYKVAGKKNTLNDLENKIIRPTYKDARIHFALVCGAISCPPIINEAYMPKKLDAQLNRQTKKAMSNPLVVTVNDDSVCVSKIFEWYAVDFVNDNQSLLDFINRYRDASIPTDKKVKYQQYDWSLNGK